MILRLNELLRGALTAAHLETASDVWQLGEVWATALGTPVAGKATPVRLVRGELVIAVAEAVWRQELALLAPQIAARLNQALGRDVVQRIRLVGGDAIVASGLSEERPRRRLPRISSAASETPSRSTTAATPSPEIAGELATALRSLAAKRAERIVADSAPSEDREPSGARSRKRW